MKRTRKQFTAQEKMALLRRHLVEKTPVSTLCDEAKLQPTVFYRWLKQLFENGAAAFERATGLSTIYLVSGHLGRRAGESANSPASRLKSTTSRRRRTL